MLRGREGVVDVVEFEKPFVKDMVEVAEESVCARLAGWTLDVYCPGSSRYVADEEVSTAPTVDDKDEQSVDKMSKISTHIL